jgi:hypothetical protein
MGSRAFAHSTLFGSTGLIYNPTAAVAPQGQVSLHASYLRETPHDVRNRGINLSGAFGVAPRWEVSLGLVDARIKGAGTDRNTTAVGGGVKYLWRTETEDSPAIALGVQQVNVLKDSTVYLVISKHLTPRQNAGGGVRGHLGVRFDRIEGTRSVTDKDESRLTAYGGIEAAISKRVLFMGEVNTRHMGLAAAPVTATVHVDVSRNVRVFGGYVHLRPGGGWIVGISYGFGRSQ